MVSSFELVDELCDETRFDKKVWAPLQQVRPFAGDGLFTSRTQEPNWHKAHSILLPNFSMRAMQGYLPMMLDIAEQLVGKWDRLNADDEIDVPGDMTRLTLDTIGLCGFDYRFNSFYREDMHPFVNSMVHALHEALERLQRLPLENQLLFINNRHFQQDMQLMNSTVDHIIQERKRNGIDTEKKDLLTYMLTGVDKQTGEHLDDVNIRYQIITFLIAGHETTSGLLSFALYNLLHHPEALEKAYREVDSVLGADLSAKPTFKQVNQLRYVSQILKETLRLWPTAPLFALYPYEDTVIGGKYRVTRDGHQIAVLIPMLHRDPAIWGDNVEEFLPERFSQAEEAKRPANAYKPFGNGQRACIGQQFAMQEAILVLGMLLQRYKFVDHKHYQFKIKETLTLKPDDFKMKIVKRTAADRTSVTVPHFGIETLNVVATKTERAQQAYTSLVSSHHTPLLVLFGSNMGTSEDLATRIANDGEDHGFDTTVASLDDYTNKLPTDGAVVVITSSYNGTPPDNAAQFVEWLKASELSSAALKGVRYTVFGAGNTDWVATYQAIPRLVDEGLERFGAKRIYPLGEGNARDDFDGQFELWYQHFWESLFKEFAIDAQAPEPVRVGNLEVEIVNFAQVHPIVASYGARPMTVTANRELYRGASERSARHLEVELPEDRTYRTGWHLGIIPRNNEALVERVARRFNLDKNTKVVLHKSDKRKTALPVEIPIHLYDLLSDYVELQDVATRKQIKLLADNTQCPPDKRKLQALSGDDEECIARYKADVLAQRKSLIDLLEEFPACELPFNLYLEQLPAIRPRYYSISSSPMHDPRHCSLTLAIVDAPAKSGHGQYRGVCTTYLKNSQPGDEIYAFVRDPKSPFLLPDDPTVPIIMVGPGSGLAPFRGFLQERAEIQARGGNIGPSLLFFGCRNPAQDFIYENELKGFVAQGVTELYTAFSRKEGSPKTYVQDMLRQQKDRVWELIQQGAIIYVCGDASSMAPDVRKAFADIYSEKTHTGETGPRPQEAEQWLDDLSASDRYLVDVWPA
jgi:cytochrome P450/NADPH-cytochrome P450 reductase